MKTIAIYLQHGTFERISTDDGSLCADVVVIEDGEVTRLVHLDYEAAISDYVAKARQKTRAFLLGTACEVAGERFLALSRDALIDATALLAAVCAEMRDLSDCVHRAVAV